MLAIIQARSSSKRFKNKILKEIFGKTLITHVYNRVKGSKNIKKIIVATSSNKSDDKFITHLKEMNIKYFRGNLRNVAKRFLIIAKKQKVKYFLRISGDSPLIEYKIIDRAYKLYKNSKNNYDLITNLFPRSFPKGQSVEIIKTSSLEKYIDNFSSKDKEHVTRFFYNNAKKFRIKNFKFYGKKKIKNQSIDTKKDLEFLKEKFKKNFLQ